MGPTKGEVVQEVVLFLRRHRAAPYCDARRTYSTQQHDNKFQITLKQIMITLRE